MRPVYFWSALILIAAGAVTIAAWPVRLEVETAAVVRGPIAWTVNEDGVTRIRERYIVSAPLAGQVQRVRLRAGDAVHAGVTPLAVIAPGDPGLLDARARAEADARVRRAGAAQRQAVPHAERARAEADHAENELARVRALFERGAANQSELDAAILLARTTAESLQSARFGQDIAQFELELARAALLRTREDAPADDAWLEIISPVTGVVLRVMQESAAVVQPGAPLVEIGDPADLEVVVDVRSIDAVRIRPGAAIIVERWGGDLPLEARVRLVEPQAFTRISALGVEEQRVRVIGDFTRGPSAHEALGDAFRIEAKIVIDSRDDVPLVPAAALFRDGGHWAVYVVEGGRAVRRSVRIGLRGGAHAEVVEGLRAGDRVVLYPGDRLAEGVRVRPADGPSR